MEFICQSKKQNNFLFNFFNMDIKEITILILTVLIFGTTGCTIVKNDSGSLAKASPTPAPEAEKKISPEDERDNHRISDVMNISAALESYAVKNNAQYPKTDGSEKISDEASDVFQAMKASGFLFQPIKDPVPDKYYYGYKSDGQAYELTAVLENKEGGRCAMAGNYCIYKFKKGEMEAAPTPEVGQ